jgi:hypothetical protein
MKKINSAVEKITCIGNCKKSKSITNFYINNNPLFSTEKLHICKSCINEFIAEKESDGYLDRVKLVLAVINKPFILEIWNISEKD